MRNCDKTKLYRFCIALIREMRFTIAIEQRCFSGNQINYNMHVQIEFVNFRSHSSTNRVEFCKITYNAIMCNYV